MRGLGNGFYAELGNYEQTDMFIGKVHGLAIQLFTKDEDFGCIEPWATLTVNLGEFIGLKDCAYVDTNNCPNFTEWLPKGVCENTGYTMGSGWCEYPLYHFNEDFLRSIGESAYEKYRADYKKCVEDFDD